MSKIWAVVLVVVVASVAFAQDGSKAVAVVGKIGTLGAGADVAFPVTDRNSVRVGFNLFGYSRGLDKDGVHYNGHLRFRSVDALWVFSPTNGVFHISGGALLYNGNKADATADVPGGQTFTLGNNTFLSSTTNPVHGTGNLALNKVAPMVLVGFGNLTHRGEDQHFAISFDVGVAFQGTPSVKLAFTGTACDASGAACADAATDPNFQAAVQNEQAKLNKDISAFKAYPVVQLSIGYKF